MYILGHTNHMGIEKMPSYLESQSVLSWNIS